MSTLGDNREAYANTIEARPSRFTNPDEYTAWAARADAWAANVTATLGTTYTTRDEAIEREVIAPIEAGDAGREEYDVDAIADDVLATVRTEDGGYGYALALDGLGFWASVARNAL